MAESDVPLAAIETWKRKASELSSQSNDALFIAATRGVEGINQYSANDSMIEPSTTANPLILPLKEEPMVSSQIIPENMQNSPHWTMGDDLKIKEENTEDMRPVLDFFNRHMQPFKEEDMPDNTMPRSEFMGADMPLKLEDAMNDSMTFGNVLQDLMDIDGHENVNDETTFENGQQGSAAVDLMEKDEEKEGASKKERSRKSSCDTRKVQTKRRNDSNQVKYAESKDRSVVDSMNQLNTPQKKRKLSHQALSQSTRKGLRVIKRNDTDLECPDCEFRTRSIHGWMKHLKSKHSATPKLVGLALLCECGHESFSDGHSRSCSFSNSTLIHKSQGPIETLDDEKTTPQCPLCNTQPTSMYGYVKHLGKYHKSTLKANGIYLKCKCDFEVRYHSNSIRAHNKKCDGRQFIIHNVSNE